VARYIVSRFKAILFKSILLIYFVLRGALKASVLRLFVLIYNYANIKKKFSTRQVAIFTKNNYFYIVDANTG
jgi:hypothetical protein